MFGGIPNRCPRPAQTPAITRSRGRTSAVLAMGPPFSCRRVSTSVDGCRLEHATNERTRASYDGAARSRSRNRAGPGEGEYVDMDRVRIDQPGAGVQHDDLVGL